MGDFMPMDLPAIPPELRTTYLMLVCVYPDDIPEDEYWPVIAILHPYLSFRVIAHILPAFTEKDYVEIFSDASGYGMDPVPSEEQIQAVRNKFLQCGYENWLKEVKLP
jgi:hypothetical protein